ncbi:MAG: GNAT family N-acetyltransferase [Actinobacteria bacterium]|nr:GNAT family N-acetyltransferase [Actinomycetota bacterium]
MASQRPLRTPGSELIGRRLTLRIHLPEGGFRDIVGILESENSIRKGDGSLIHFQPQEVAIWRAIVPAPDKAGKGAPLSLRIQEIELAANATWPAKEEAHLGDWILRASGKFTKRANSALAIGNPDTDLDTAIKKVIDFYNSRNLPPSFHIALPTYNELGNRLRNQGWQSDISVNVMVADIDEVINLSRPKETERENHWEVEDAPSDKWIALQNDQGVSEIMKRAPARYASLRINRELVAVGRASNFEKWTVLTRLFVRPDYRGEGIGRELILFILHDAQRLGATKVILQVDSKNAKAISLYDKAGFRLHHTYEYFSYQPESAIVGGC